MSSDTDPMDDGATAPGSGSGGSDRSARGSRGLAHALRFRDRSVFDGVARREIGRVDLVAHSVAVLVPSLTALGSGLAFPAFVGPGFWLSTLLGFGMVALLTFVFNQFSTRFKSAGTLYTFVAKGLGPTAALLVAAALVIGYSAIIGFGLTDGARRFNAALSADRLLPNEGTVGMVVALVVGVLLCLLAMSRGIHWSTRAAFIVEAISFVVLIVIFVTWTSKYGWPDLGVFSLEGASPARILIGAASIVTLTLAFESSASLSLETRRPFRDVPFALRFSVGLAAVLFALANIVATTRPANAPSIWSWRWLAPGVEYSVGDALVLVVLAVSLLVLAFCVWSALSRLLFSLAREGVLPAALGRLSKRGIPMIAAIAVTPLALAPPLIAISIPPGSYLGWDLKEAATVVICLAYALTAIALPRFLASIDELTPAPVIGSALAAVGVIAVLVHELVRELGEGNYLAVGMVVAAVVLGLLMRRRAGRRATLDDRYVGMHDEALVAAVVLLPPNTPLNAHADE